MNIIGIDLGTTSICGIKMNAATGVVSESITTDSNAFIKTSNSWEKIQSPQKIIDIAFEIVNKLVDKDTASIGITGQMHGILYVDSDGNAVSPLYTWQDERGNLKYKDTTYAEHLESFSGYGNTTDFFNKINGLRPQNAVSYCTIHDYLVMKLVGNTKPIIHSTDAASFGLYDLKENRFNYDVNAEIVCDYRIAGNYKNIPVSVAIGDNQASVFSTLTDKNDILINIGTGSQISVISPKIIIADNIETRPYFDNEYLIVGAALCGGRAYSVLKDFFKSIICQCTNVDDSQVYKIMGDFIKNDDIDEIKVDTRFAGTRVNPQLRGSITNVSVENFTPNMLTYGVMNGILQELNTLYSSMGVSSTGIVGSGNGLRKNQRLIEIAEKTFGHKIKIPIHLEEAAVGAALFSGVSAGVYPNSSFAQSKIVYYK